MYHLNQVSGIMADGEKQRRKGSIQGVGMQSIRLAVIGVRQSVSDQPHEKKKSDHYF